MDEILNFIFQYCCGFIKKYGFKVTTACISESFGDAAIVVENDNLKLVFIRDRGQLFLDFHSKFDKKKKNPYSIDLVRQLVTGEETRYSLLDDNNGVFLEGKFDEIVHLFEKDNASRTISELTILERKRMKEMWK